MPIHDQSYRRYHGDRSPQGRAWTVIAASGIRQMLAKKKFLALLVLAWLPFVVRSVQMYLAANFSQLSIIAPSASTFRQFLDFQEVFVFFITIFTGAGLIANDMRANALQIYLAKPMSRFEYIAGKFAVLAFFLLLVTWLPATMLLIIQIVFAGNLQFISANLYLIPAILVATGIETMVLTMVMLALSSLSKSARFVGILYAGALFFTQGLYGVVFLVTHSTRFTWISPAATLQHLIDVIFRVPPRFETPALVSVLAVLVIVALSALVLERRVRGVEVVT
jgi:ABC-type transport system involved in multi-copper enzyme maturation permease subunit